MSWKSAGNLLGWICRHPGFGNRKSIQPVKSPLWQCRTSTRFQGSVCVFYVCVLFWSSFVERFTERVGLRWSVQPVWPNQLHCLLWRNSDEPHW